MSRREEADEASLLQRVHDGDRVALEAILREHAAGVHAVCRRLCRNPHDAEDAAQEALVAVARGLPRFDGRSSVRTWVYRVATNACLDELRRVRRRPVPSDVDLGAPGPPATIRGDVGRSVDPEEAAVRAEQRRALVQALGDLPEDQRAAVVLRDVADLDYAAIAEVLDVPVGTVRSRIARGRGRLADALTDLHDDDGPDDDGGTARTDPSSEEVELP